MVFSKIAKFRVDLFAPAKPYIKRESDGYINENVKLCKLALNAF